MRIHTGGQPFLPSLLLKDTLEDIILQVIVPHLLFRVLSYPPCVKVLDDLISNLDFLSTVSLRYIHVIIFSSSKVGINTNNPISFYHAIAIPL